MIRHGLSSNTIVDALFTDLELPQLQWLRKFLIRIRSSDPDVLPRWLVHLLGGVSKSTALSLEVCLSTQTIYSLENPEGQRWSVIDELTAKNIATSLELTVITGKPVATFEAFFKRWMPRTSSRQGDAKLAITHDRSAWTAISRRPWIGQCIPY